MIHPPRISDHRPSLLHQVFGVPAAMVWKSIRSVVQGEVRPVRSRSGGGLLALLALAATASAELTVHDSLNRYSLYGRRLVFFGDNANSAAGGWVGSDSLIDIYGNNSLRSNVTSGYRFNMGNAGPDSVWGWLNVKNFIRAPYNFQVDSGIFVGDSAFFGHNTRSPKGVRVGAGSVGVIQLEANGTNYDLGGGAFTNGSTTRYTGSGVPGVTWSANPPPPFMGFALPDTTITPVGTPLNIDASNWTYDNRTLVCADAPLAAIPGCKDTTITMATTGTITVGRIPPGNYGDLKLGFGTDLFMGEGVYSFRSIHMKNGSVNSTRLLAIQPNGVRTVVYAEQGLVADNPDASRPTIIAPIDYEKGYGVGVNQFAGGTMMIVSHRSVLLPNFTEVWSTITVPNDTIRIKDKVKLFGQGFAMRIIADNNFKGTDGAFIPYFPDPPVVTVKNFDATVVEGNPTDPVRYAKFLLTMDHINGLPVKVFYHTELTGVGYGFAREGNDYTKVVKDSVTIGPTFLYDTIRVAITADLTYEPTETFRIRLDSSKFGTLGKTRADSVGVGTIYDNDTPPLFKFVNGVDSAAESVARPRIIVRLNKVQTDTVWVDVVDRGTGTATWNTDYTYGTGRKETLRFAPGDTLDTLTTLTIVDDARFEPVETIRFALTNPVGGRLDSTADTVHLQRILENDSAPALFFARTDVIEPDEGATTTMKIVVSLVDATTGAALTEAPQLPLNYAWNTRDFTAFVASGDYVRPIDTVRVFPAGLLTDTLRIVVNGDNRFEGIEQIQVNMVGTGFVNLNYAKSTKLQYGRILDNEGRPALRLTGGSKLEPDAPSTDSILFVVSLHDSATGVALTSARSPGLPVSYAWSTVDQTARAGFDYDTLGRSGTRTIPVGKLVDSFWVTVLGDDRYEGTETFLLNLTAGTNAHPSSAQNILSAQGTILDDESRPAVCITDNAITEGASGTTSTLNFTVFLADSAVGCGKPLVAIQAPELPVRFTWATSDSTAVQPSDYVAAGKADSVARLTLSTLLPVVINGDALYEPSEFLKVGLSAVSNGRLADPLGVGTINENAAPPTISIGDIDSLEGNVPGGRLWRFKVKLSAKSGVDAKFAWSTRGGPADSATAGEDFDAVTSTSVTIPAGSDSAFLDVLVRGDTKYENNEPFLVLLSPVSGITTTGSDTLAVGRILNDDAAPTIASIVSVDSLEGNTGTKVMRFKLKTNVKSGLPATFSWWTVGGAGPDSATAAADFANVGVTSLTIPVGADSAYLDVTISGDLLHEKNEVFGVVATPGTGMGGVSVSARGTILNDDAMPVVTIGNAPDITEPAAFGATSNARFPVKLSAPSGLPVTISFLSADSSARSGLDYQAVSGTLVFAPGVTDSVIAVPVLGDTLDEPTEVFRVVLASASGATGAPDTGFARILDEDAAPQIHVDDISVAEPLSASATTAATVRAWLQRPSALDVRFAWSTRNGTALSGAGDYDSTGSALVTIPAGQTFVDLLTVVRGDNVANEGPETYRVALQSIVNASGTDTSATVSITDRTPVPTLSIASSDTVDEADVAVPFTLSLDRPSAINVVVRVRTYGVTAQAGADFNALDTLVTIPAGTVSLSGISVRIREDVRYERAIEVFEVRLDTATGAVDPDGKVLAIVGIRDDEPVPSLSVTGATVNEPVAYGDSVRAVFTITLSGPSELPISVDWMTDSVTAKPGTDFVAAGSVAMFPADSLVRRVEVHVLGDSLDEPDESFLVKLSNATVASIAKDTATGRILDTDAAPAVRVNDPESVPEGGAIRFTATLERPSAKTIVFVWSTVDSSAVHDSDFVAITRQRVTIPAGQRSASLVVSTLSDVVAGEPDEVLFVALDSLVNVRGADTVGRGLITESSGRPVLSIDSVGTFREPASDSLVHFNLRLSTISATPVTVRFRTVSGTATVGRDLVDTTGTVTFLAGQQLVRLPIRVMADALHEAAFENFTVVLDSVKAASLSSDIGLGVIADNDAAPSVSVTDTSISEPATELIRDSARIVVRLSAPSELEARVDLVLFDSTAVSPLDYLRVGATIVFAPGETVKVHSVGVPGDSLDEPEEAFVVRLRNPLQSSLGDSAGKVRIFDTDPSPTLWLVNTTASEGDTASMLLRLERPSALDVVFTWSTVDGSARRDSDYVAVTLRRDTIRAGQTTLSARVPVLADSIANEGNEAFEVRIVTLTNAILSDSTGTVTITDLTPAPMISILDAGSVVEDDTYLDFPVRLDRPSAVPVQVRWTSVSGTALAGLDFADTSAIVTIPAGARSATVRVRVLEDNLYEPVVETLQVVLTTPVSASILVDRATGKIIDDNDNPPVRISNSPAVVEGATALFPVKLDNPSADTVFVSWATRDLSAKAPHDYIADSGTVVFLPGQVLRTLSVRTLVDSLWEPAESLQVRLKSVRGGFIPATDSVGLVRVNEEGPFPTVAFRAADTSVVEATAGTVNVGLVLSRRASIPLDVTLTLGTSSTATSGLDFRLAGTGIRFAPGTDTASYPVVVLDDSLDEVDETVLLGLAQVDSLSPSGQTSFALTILDDDEAPQVVFAVDSQTVMESVGLVNVTATLTRKSAKAIDVWYSVSGTATAGGVDHNLSAFHFTFEPGKDTARIQFRVVDDPLDEDDETVVVGLDSTINGSLKAGEKQIVLIQDNDDAPKARFLDTLLAVKENVGTVSLPIRLDHPSIRPTTFEITARPGSAILDSLRLGSDANLGSGAVYRVTIPAYDTVGVFELVILGDGRVEPSEDFRLSLGGSTNANPATSSTVRVVILDDDRYPEVEITRPIDSAETNNPNQVVEWKWDGIGQKPSDTTLVEGWNRIRRCAVDTAGNRACDSIDVFGDFTPPKVTITRPESLFLTNKPVVNVCWKVVDSGATWRKVDSLCGDTTLTEGTHTVVKRSCDKLGNCSQDQIIVRVDLTPPTGVFVRPPDSAHVRVTEQPALIRWIDDGDTIWVRDTLTLRRFGWNTFTATYTDKAGNEGRTTVHLFLEIPEVQVGWYLDTDGDGDIDAAVVEFDAPWTSDTLPTFSFRLGDNERVDVKSDGWYKDGTRGTPALDKDGKVITQDGKTVYLAPGIPVTDAKGVPLKDSQTGKILISPVGELWRDASGNPVYDAEGRELFRVPGPGTEDRSRIVVKFGTNFPYGVTSVDSSTDSGRLVVSLPVYGESGSPSIRDVAATFPMSDSVAPIIAKAEVRRTEDYNGMDTLFVTPSEAVKLDEKLGLIEIKVNGIWHTVPQDSVFQAEDGRIWFLVAPGDSGSPKPGVQIRFLEGVTDLKGNSVDPGTSTWTTIVVGPPRPPLLKIDLPTPVKSVPAEEMSVNRPGGFVIRATDRSSPDQYSWWKPGAGYVDGSDPDIRNICPDLRFCNGIELYVNRPVRMILYMYDLAGTFVVNQEIDISQEDIDGLRADKLDRVRIQLQWNMRDAKGEVVGSGVYLWRIVSYVRTEQGGVPVMTNQVVKVGVKSVLQ